MLYESAFSAESAKTQIMLVGTYHFSNPGKDLNNVKAVDIFAAGASRARTRRGRRFPIRGSRRLGVQLVDPLGYLAET